ncbi:hypothetical protein GCM10011488_68560 [Steroidobacter agaridevorans]|nr:hypothetical protein GCM10011488_68560 [Steroidobacter agaridevorans]
MRLAEDQTQLSAPATAPASVEPFEWLHHRLSSGPRSPQRAADARASFDDSLTSLLETEQAASRAHPEKHC